MRFLTMNCKVILICLYLVFVESVFSAEKSRVIVVSGENDIIREETGKAITAVIQEINKIAEGNGNPDNVKGLFTPQAFEYFKDLIIASGFYSTIPEYRTHILHTANGKYEIRGIKVRVRLGETQGDDIQELVFVFNFRLFIENIQFAMEEHHYQRLIEEGRELDDMVFRQQVLSFIEDFRTAHNRKDIAYLEKAYSDGALIIVGRVLEREEKSDDYLRYSSLSEQKIEFIKLSKKQYIDRLRTVFKLNSFVRILFDEAQIIRHSKYKDIYGVKLKQRWNSSNYSDEGYLFVMIDFHQADRPLIHVRSWQPEPFEDGSVVGLGDFEIIE